MKIKTAIITVSDKGYIGQREDKSGPAIADFLAGYEDYLVVSSHLLPDEKDKISALLIELADGGKVDLILTTGGTGFTPRDVTPEATLDVLERLAPGIPEAMRAYGLSITPYAMLSRAQAGLRGRTVIINLPGSPKAALENLTPIVKVLPHSFEMGDH